MELVLDTELALDGIPGTVPGVGMPALAGAAHGVIQATVGAAHGVIRVMAGVIQAMAGEVHGDGVILMAGVVMAGAIPGVAVDLVIQDSVLRALGTVMTMEAVELFMVTAIAPATIPSMIQSQVT